MAACCCLSFCVKLKRCSWKAAAPPSNPQIYTDRERGGAAHTDTSNYKHSCSHKVKVHCIYLFPKYTQNTKHASGLPLASLSLFVLFQSVIIPVQHFYRPSSHHAPGEGQSSPGQVTSPNQIEMMKDLLSSGYAASCSEFSPPQMLTTVKWNISVDFEVMNSEVKTFKIWWST